MNRPVIRAPIARPWNRGAALFYALMVSILMLTFVMPFLFKLSGRMRISEKSFKSLAALNLAEAGVERAIWELNYGNISSWSGNILDRTLTLSSVQAAGGQVAGDVSIEVINPSGDVPVVVSTGSVPWTSNLRVTRRIRIGLSRSFLSHFRFGIFGDEGFDLHGNAYIDSYDSTKGAYDPLFRLMHGNVGTNARHRWDVVLLNNTTVYGDVATGFESDPSVVIRLANNAQIVGERTTLAQPNVLPAVAPPFLTPKGAYFLGGSNTAMITESGMYSSFKIDNNARVTISGNVQLYVNGDFSMLSNSVLQIAPGSQVEITLGNGVFTQSSNTQINNISRDPKALAILGTSDFKTMYWRSNSQFWGVVYIPSAAVDYSANSDFFGSMVCKHISMSSNSGIHYDESLGSWTKYGTTQSLFQVKNWQEY
jgi:hypothetical protein